MAVHHFNKEDFAKWVVNGNVDNAQNVRKLPAVLANPIAKDKFLKSNISEAIKNLNVNEKKSKELSSVPMDELVVELTNRIRGIEFKQVKALTNNAKYEEQKNDILVLLDELNELVIEIEGD